MSRAQPVFLVLAAVFAASRAGACSPPPATPSRAELRKLAIDQVRQATYIIDGIALGWSRQGLVVSVLRQFKGPQRASLTYRPDDCSSLAPPLGRRVRLLLRADIGTALLAAGSDSYDADDPARLERLVDRLIGTPRLPGTYSVAENYPPPP